MLSVSNRHERLLLLPAALHIMPMNNPCNDSLIIFVSHYMGHYMCICVKRKQRIRSTCTVEKVLPGKAAKPMLATEKDARRNTRSERCKKRIIRKKKLFIYS